VGFVLGGHKLPLNMFWKTAYFCIMVSSGFRFAGWRPCGPENNCVCDPDDLDRKE
jgi:hypothetical protein